VINFSTLGLRSYKGSPPRGHRIASAAAMGCVLVGVSAVRAPGVGLVLVAMLAGLARRHVLAAHCADAVVLSADRSGQQVAIASSAFRAKRDGVSARTDDALVEKNALYLRLDKLLEHKGPLFPPAFAGGCASAGRTCSEPISTSCTTIQRTPISSRRRLTMTTTSAAMAAGDKRHDCRQVVIALTAMPRGFPLVYEVPHGNTSRQHDASRCEPQDRNPIRQGATITARALKAFPFPILRLKCVVNAPPMGIIFMLSLLARPDYAVEDFLFAIVESRVWRLPIPRSLSWSRNLAAVPVYRTAIGREARPGATTW
jgi:hypothetical protein